MAADADATYDDQIELDLSAIVPLVALPGSPDRVVPVSEVAGTPIDQVMVGSCTNGSWHDMSSVVGVVRDKQVHPSISFVVFPGSHRILETMAREGLLADLLATGATVSEPTCGSCAGIGHVPAAGTKSLRAFNRNFPGRSGVKGDEIYLCSSVVAAASALTGVITDPRTLGVEPGVTLPAKFAASVAGFVAPDGQGEVVRGPNIKPVPLGEPVAEYAGSAGAAQARRQGLDRRHLAGRLRRAGVPLERAGHRRALLQVRRPPTSWPARRRPVAASSWPARRTGKAPRARRR